MKNNRVAKIKPFIPTTMKRTSFLGIMLILTIPCSLFTRGQEERPWFQGGPWQRPIANHFKGHNTVAFYEIFNEPTIYRGQLGTMTWPEWKEINENVIQLIRAYDPETIPLVAGFDWAYELTESGIFFRKAMHGELEVQND
jgi:hypothetical protein